MDLLCFSSYYCTTTLRSAHRTLLLIRFMHSYLFVVVVAPDRIERLSFFCPWLHLVCNWSGSTFNFPAKLMKLILIGSLPVREPASRPITTRPYGPAVLCTVSE